MKERTLIIGDVHGCIDELRELLSVAEYNPCDRLIFVGDVINKGPCSLEVLQLIESLEAECILGNHELGFINYLERGRRPLSNRFEALMSELGEDLDKWLEWMKGLPLYIEDDDFIVVHGGVIPGIRLEDIPPSIITRVRTWDGRGDDLSDKRNPPWYELYHGEKTVVYGHWAAKGLNIREKTIGLDSGCVWGKKLSLLVWESKEIIQTDARMPYCSIKEK